MGGIVMKTIIFLLVTLLDILLLVSGYKKNNILFKGIGCILFIPVVFGIGSLFYQVFIS
jgi:hypothetical protein